MGALMDRIKAEVDRLTWMTQLKMEAAATVRVHGNEAYA